MSQNDKNNNHTYSPLENITIHFATLSCYDSNKTEIQYCLCDHHFVLAFKLFRQYNYSNALHNITIALNTALPYHAYYHFCGSIFYCNYAIITSNQEFITKSIFLDHLYAPACHLQNNFTQSLQYYEPNISKDCLTTEPQLILPCFKVWWKPYLQDNLQNISNVDNLVQIYKDIETIYTAKHKEYHLYISNLYNLRAKVYYALGSIDMCKYDLSRSIEMEPTNSQNVAIQQAMYCI